ncbi:hypothetical protein EJ06DRAFT_585209 [Trichodelitschia bisporula]|uniref:Sin3-associated polypeptide Sap18 n=1 Tax=Trichodelitschia bisporula TaxID=703511 RepID=A0A6G1HK81_9PEZI|nr:hypothetical protein EJ06DRAFT_585209 [Trichodelitschia bisporula]
MAQKVDRTTTTPFLLKLFYRTGAFHRLEEFAPNQPAPQHVQIYTWTSCTLRELTHLLTTALPSLLPSPAIGTRLSFRLIFPDIRDPQRQGPGRFTSKDLGSVVIGAGGPGVDLRNDEDDARPADRLEGDADKTLGDARFVIGDYVSCAVFPPLPNGDVAAPPGPRGLRSPEFPRGPGPVRENGFGGGFGRGRGRYEAPRGSVPSGEWRRGEVPPGSMGAGFSPRGRGRGRAY